MNSYQDRAYAAESQVRALAKRIAALERQLERHAVLLHSANHNWALYGVADCPELECEEYRALLSPAPADAAAKEETS